MKKFIHTLLFCAMSPWMMAQYTYFNHGYAPPYPEIGSGESTNLIVRGDSLLVYGFHPFDSEFGRSILILDETGTLLQTLNIGVGNDIHFTGFSDTVYPFADGYVWSGGNDQYPFIIWMDDQFNEIHRTEKPELFTDTTYSTFFTSCISQNGNLISTGRRVYDLDPEVPGQDFVHLILAEHNANGEELWFKEFDLNELNIGPSYAGPSVYPQGGITQLISGEILLWCLVGQDNDCFVFKFDPEGNYLDHVHWGNTDVSDGSPWPVQISENEFVFAHNIFSHSEGDYYMNKPRMGILNSDDLSIQLFSSLDHPLCYGMLTDMERTIDGHYVLLGFGHDSGGEDMGKAFMLMADEEGNEIWYHEYLPPDIYDTPTAYDLELTTDGGFSFVGNYHIQSEFYYKTWVVKTDACGEEIFNGCPAVIDVVEDKISNKGIHLYPNPANALLMIDYEPAGIYSISIYDTIGKLVLQQNTDPFATQFYLDLSELVASIYEVRILSMDGKIMESTKLIKE